MIKTAMSREEVSSSNITSIGYDPEEKILEVEFHNGGIYQYYDVPSNVYDAMIGAPSKGKFLHAQIKGNYEYKKVS